LMMYRRVCFRRCLGIQFNKAFLSAAQC